MMHWQIMCIAFMWGLGTTLAGIKCWKIKEGAFVFWFGWALIILAAVYGK